MVLLAVGPCGAVERHLLRDALAPGTPVRSNSARDASIVLAQGGEEAGKPVQGYRLAFLGEVSAPGR
jgi:hypothetical protein